MTNEREIIIFMKTEMTQKIPNAFIAFISIASLMMYIFYAQFDYPFTTTLFLYIAFGGFLLWMFLYRKIIITTQMFIMALVVAIVIVESYYSKVPEKGNREAILMGVSWILLIVFAQNENLLNMLKKVVFFGACTVLIGIMIHYLFPSQVNEFLKQTVTMESYEELMWVYEVGGIYTGFTVLTSEAAYFCATLFGFLAFGWIEKKKLPFINKLFYLAIIVLSIYAIILTSKRGIAVALIIAFFLTYVFWKKFSGKAIAGAFSLIIVGIIVISILNEQNAEVSAFLQRFDSMGSGGDITTGRTEIWQRAIDGLTNWVIGMGTGSSYMIFWTGLHNIYLQIIFDHGIIGLIFYLVFFIYNFAYAVRRKDPMSMFIQLLVLIYGMSGNPIYSNAFFITYLIFSVIPVETYNKKVTT